MGLFWATVICHGFRLPHLVDILPTIPKEWIIQDTTGVTFACPSTIKWLKPLSPCIDNGDMAQGFVAMEELIQCTDILRTHFEINDDNQRQLESIYQHYQEMLSPNETIDKICNLTLEYMWATWNVNKVQELCFQKSLPIK